LLNIRSIHITKIEGKNKEILKEYLDENKMK